MPQVTAQVDFFGIPTDTVDKEDPIEAMISKFKESISDLGDSYEVSLFSASIEEIGADTGKVSVELTFQSSDFEEELEEQLDDETELSDLTNDQMEEECSTLLRSVLDALCESSEFEYDIADISV